TGPFRQAGTFDSAAFAAFLVTVPANINFVVSVEVNFYQKYRAYFTAVNSGGTLAQISLAREDMITSMRHEIFKLAQVQVFCMVAYIIFARYLLEAIGFTADMIEMFQVMSIGYSAYAIANSIMLLQLYFDDRKGALASCLVFFLVNLVVSLWTRTGPPLYYGIGIVAGGIAMYLTAMPRLYRYVKHIDYHVFCGQPVLASRKTGLWTRLAVMLDERAAVWAGETYKGRRETK
ncbi:MAG: exopolysaccharide Pel transporter PelG, partial [Eubacteriales bacterium]|nr:exopolysaccharide Pel transporter PelG [Eubacteriales bacterium]